jgi:hypothetical protein
MKGIIILDTGASCHMFNTNIMMSNYRNINNTTYKITGFNGSSESAIVVGDIGILKDVLHIKKKNYPTVGILFFSLIMNHM